MEILTLVKAGMRNRKGIYFGFVLLTTLIVVSVMTMIGVSKNYNAGIKRAFELEDRGVIYGFFSDGYYSQELDDKVKSSELVQKVYSIDAINAVNISCNDKSDGNAYTVLKMQDTFRIFSSDYRSLEIYNKENELKKGEIYLPYGLKSMYKANPGDKIKMDFLGITREFTIKGFMQEAYMGTSIMGYKTVCISDEEFDELYADIKSNMKTEDDNWAVGKVVFVYPSEKAPESSDMMLRKLNLETKFNDLSGRLVTRETSEHYTGIYINIILAVVSGFAALLFVIFLIIAGHNVSSEIDIDYTNLGVMKSQGMASAVFIKVYMIQYILAELIGLLIGFAITIPLERWMSHIFFDMTAILPTDSFPVLEGVLLTILLFVVTACYILLFTRKISRVSPVNAIRSGKNDVYFENRFNTPVARWCLRTSLGLRQITSAPKRYISVILVTSLLVFTVITVELMGGFVKSRDALGSMGEPFCEIEFAFNNQVEDGTIENIENIVKSHTDITGRVYKSHLYVSINGESVMLSVKAYPEEYSSVYKGREVKYDNEIVISEQVARLLDIDIGDTVTIGRRDFSADYIVVGFWQTMNDTGKAISMSLDGLSRLKEDPDVKYTVDHLNMYKLSIEDTSEGPKIVDEIKEQYGDLIDIKYLNYDEALGDFGELFYVAADGSGLLIYILTFVFALVTVFMMCTKAFIQERTDIGISRVIGFKVGDVRLQFAARFGFISLISSVIGIILARLLSEKLIGVIFSMFGIPHIEMKYSVNAFALPVIAFLVMYILFGYIASGKVRSVSSRELITE